MIITAQIRGRCQKSSVVVLEKMSGTAEDPDALPTGVPLVAGIFIATMMSVISNFLYGRGVGDISCMYQLKYSPSREAFAVWALIYATCGVTIAGQYIAHDVGDPIFASDGGNAFYAMAWLCAAFWTPLFTTNTPFAHLCASLVLCLCSTLALTATAFENAWGPGGDERRRWVICMPFALLAGWTLTAAALSVGIAWLAYNAESDDEPCSENYRSGLRLLSWPSTWTHPPHWLPIGLAVGVGYSCVVAREPIVPLPVAWGIFWMPPTVPNAAAFLILVGASVWVFVLVYTNSTI